MKRHVPLLSAVWTAAAVLLMGQPAAAFPGFYVGKNAAKRLANSTHVVIMRKGDTSAVTVMPDYQGPFEPFALVMAVPADVTPEHVKIVKRNFVDRVEQMTAPRFHEFWEMDPCEPGPAQQEWERNMAASSDTAFLGGAMPSSGEKRVPKELLLTVTPEYKDKSEYGLSLLSEEESKNLVETLKQQGWVVPEAAANAAKPYVDAGMKFVVATVDPDAMELIGGDRAVLSPIRFSTEKPYESVTSRLGLAAADPTQKQELVLYTLHPDAQYETKNYKTLVPPTNIEVDFKVKERMGEFYGGLHDLILQKNPNAFLLEYAWQSEGCGRPCQNEPLLIHEILSLGGDVFEEAVPKEEREPKPPELTEDEKKQQKADLELMPPKDRAKAKKEMEEQRRELARRKALLARQKYIVTRLHYRYDAAGLPQDPKLGPAPQKLEGGTGIPKGEKHEVSTEVKPGSESRLQTRYNFFHPWKGMMKCEQPERYKWGKAPRTYRGLRKIWVADDLARKNRKLFVTAEMIKDPIPALGLVPTQAAPLDAGVGDAGTATGEAKKGCGCRIPGSPAAGSSLAGGLALLLLAAAALGRRSRRDYSA
jgi:MYXO-CTERM domain-containing protein